MATLEELFSQAPKDPEPETAKPSMQKLFKDAGQKPQSMIETELPQLLKSFGISAQGIELNPIGRMQLLSRIDAKFGKDKPPELKELLATFDKLAKQMPKDETSERIANEKSERTLAALLGGL